MAFNLKITRGKDIMPGCSYSEYLFDPTRLPRAFGLINYGNTCWLNAFTQLLMSLEPFNRILSEAKPSKKSIIPAYLAVFSGNVVKFREVFAGFDMRHALQQCADEALTLFIDAVQLAPATGMLRMIYKFDAECACGRRTTAADPVYRAAIYPPAIESAAEFVERLRGGRVPVDYKCEQCGGKITNRVERLARVENVIMVTFYQFTGKYEHYFPYEFSLPGPTGAQHIFRLVAQIEHAGDTGGGHYWARVQRQDGVFMINDAQVNPSQFGPSRETYIIAYCRIQ